MCHTTTDIDLLLTYVSIDCALVTIWIFSLSLVIEILSLLLLLHLAENAIYISFKVLWLN